MQNGAEFQTAIRKLKESYDCAVAAFILAGADMSVMPPSRIDASSNELQTTGPRDPVTGNLLPAGSPYSRAHDVTRRAGDEPPKE